MPGNFPRRHFFSPKEDGGDTDQLCFSEKQSFSKILNVNIANLKFQIANFSPLPPTIQIADLGKGGIFIETDVWVKSISRKN